MAFDLFLTMFGNMVFQTYLVAAGTSSLREAIKLFWTFRVPWGWAYTAGTVDRLGSPIQLRLLQPHADLAAHRPHRHGALQAPYMVCLLPHGNHDAGDLQKLKNKE